ncbi:MAG: DMT family transporter [Myxococcota bacterium]
MLGETLALCAAMVWSLSIVLFKRSEAISPQGMNLFKNLTAISLLLLTMPLLGVGFLAERTPEDWLRLTISGVLGIGIADTATFMALRRLGPGLLAIVDCAYSPTVVLMAVVFLGEQVGPIFLLGAALVVLGVGWASADRITRPPDFWTGLGLGVFGITAMAAGVTLAKPALESGHLVELTLIRLVAGVVFQLLWILVDPRQRHALQALRPQPAWKTLLPASFLGSYVSMMLWLGGFKYADASAAAVLNQMSTIFIIFMAWLILGEAVTRRKLIGAGVAMAGAITIILLG